jgi:hypothetical protein
VIAVADDVDFALTYPVADRDLFEMANLYPRDTGLKMTIWVSPHRHARHDVRIMVCMDPGDRMDADQTATVAVRPAPRLVHGELSGDDLRDVSRWIALNEASLVGYWDGALSTVECVQGLAKV